MYDLAGTIGSTACRLFDGLALSMCQTGDEMIVVGLTIISVVSAAGVMFAFVKIDRLT
jgi:hypothetical protein